MIKDLIATAASKLPERLWGKGLSDTCLLPYYHVVSDDWVPHVSPLYRFRTIAEFKADLDYFLQGRKALTLEDFLQSVDQVGHPPRNSFLLTFDDGFREMHEVVAPILWEKGVPAVFFLNSASLGNHEMIHHQRIALVMDFLRKEGSPLAREMVQDQLAEIGIKGESAIESMRLVPWSCRDVVVGIGSKIGVDFEGYLKAKQPYLSEQQAGELLEKGFALGAHSLDHPVYGDLSLAEQISQTEECASILSERLSCPIRSFAFPHSDRGVDSAFFERLSATTEIKVTFGTGGLKESPHSGHFQRFSMEHTRLNAAAVMTRARLRALRKGE